MQAPDKAPEPVSFFTPIGYQTGDCGYCRGEDTSASFYVSTKYLHIDHYQALVDLGWRRSGSLLYKPDLRHSCCPHYTIRLPADQFKPRKDQRAAIHRWNRHVLGEEYIKEAAKLYPKSKQEKARQKNGFNLTTVVHESEYASLPQPPEPAHKFEVTLEPDSFTEEKFKLYENYQKHVHHDPPEKISRNGFTRFLCSSPLKGLKSRIINGVEQHLGSFHHCYRLNGRLIAMSVLDLLPHCVSGVYFIYHSDFEQWSFGKISAVREACLALEAGYQYYYMGYYIHSCAKMRYKNDYKPQYFLDLETFQWNPLDEEAKKLLDEHHYLSISRVRQTQQGEAPSVITPKANDQKNEQDTSQRQIFDSASAACGAVEDGLSLFEVDFAGMLTEEKLMQGVDLGKISIQIRKDLIVPAEALVNWENWNIHEQFNPKGHVAQIAACVGPEVAKGMVVSFSHSE